MERGTRVAGKYELRERLGRGGMGEVWSGRDRDLHRNVAVKLLVRDDDAAPELLHRFEREAIAAAQINHPNVVSLYDRGVHDGLAFLVMEHVDGVTLARHLNEHAPLPVARALEIAQEICAALVAAHRAEVVHYDIKPSNVMLTTEGRVKVVDFGIAGFAHTHTFTVVPTSVLSPVGTALYGAPEQFLDERGDHRSDLYALGGVLFALLTGEPPFGDGNPLSVIRRKLDEEPRALRDLRTDVPEPVAELVTHLLQRDPDQRPQTASAVYERLERLRSTDPTPEGTTPGGTTTDGTTPGGTTTDGSTPGGTETGDAEDDTARLPPPERTRTMADAVPQPPPPRPVAPFRGPFEITWSGREPVSDYVTYRHRPLLWHWIVFPVLTLAALGLTISTTVMWTQHGHLHDDEVPLLQLGIVADVVLLIYLQRLVVRTRGWRRHRRSIGQRSSWSLRVDADGITTTDPRRATPLGGPAGRRTYGWDQVATLSLGYLREFPGGPRYTALQVRSAADGNPFGRSRPAGLVHCRPVRERRGRRPLCVLGPLTEPQHQDLVTALTQHSGGRWDPATGA